jgi:hypothetical protein
VPKSLEVVIVYNDYNTISLSLPYKARPTKGSTSKGFYGMQNIIILKISKSKEKKLL